MPGLDPAQYEAWYHTPRGAWTGNTEFALLMKALRPSPDAALLDVGCGTGYFSRRFGDAGLRVIGVDPNQAMLDYANSRGGNIDYWQGSALHLPFDDHSFDYAAAITSLCFIEPPEQAIAEMWRVSRRAVVVGLLNRHSLLYKAKHGRGGYEGARWDSVEDARQWLAPLLSAAPTDIRSAIFLPHGGALARIMERCLPNCLTLGGFLVVAFRRR